jgi:hypothetical protein
MTFNRPNHNSRAGISWWREPGGPPLDVFAPADRRPRPRALLTPGPPATWRFAPPGRPPGMRPQADVDLVGLGEGLDGLGDALEERTKFLALRLREVANLEAVAERFDDQGAHPQWPRAVLHHPVRRRARPPPGQRCCPRDQLTGIAIRRHRFLSDLAISPLGSRHMCPDPLLWGHGSGPLTSAHRVTIREHYIVGAARGSRLYIRSASFRTGVTDVCATTAPVVYPAEPGWESEDCPIGQPPDPIPKGTGDNSLVEKRRMKRRR